MATNTPSNIELNDPTLTSTAVDRLNYCSAFITLLRATGNYTLSRGFVSVKLIATSFVLAKLGGDAAAAGPILTGMTYVVIGSCRAFMNSTGVFIGEAFGSDNKQKSGSILWRSWLIATTLTALIVPLLWYTAEISSFFITNNTQGISTEIGGYFSILSLGSPAYLWLAADQQFSLAIKKNWIPLVVGGLFSCLTMGIGFPLALMDCGVHNITNNSTTSPSEQLPCSYFSGTKGLAWGVVVAAYLSLLLIRTYYACNANQLREYQLFSCQPRVIFERKEICRAAKLGAGFAFNNITEWLNLVVLSFISTYIGAADAQSPAIQLLSGYVLIQSGYSQAVSVLLSRIAGQQKKLSDQEPQTEHTKKDLRTLGYNAVMLEHVGLLGSLVGAAIVTLIFALAGKKLVSLIGDLTETSDIDLAYLILLIVGTSLFLDGPRNVRAAALRGNKKEAFIPASISFISMTVLVAPIAAILTILEKLSAHWVYTTRSIGLLIAVLGISLRWKKRTNFSCSDMFFPRRKIDPDLTQKLLATQ